MDVRKQKVLDYYEKELQKMLSDTDFERYFGSGVKQKIIKYSDLAHYPTMQDLLPEEKDYRIVLTENKPNSGHWCALLRNGNNYEWWDSYDSYLTIPILPFLPYDSYLLIVPCSNQCIPTTIMLH